MVQLTTGISDLNNNDMIYNYLLNNGVKLWEETSKEYALSRDNSLKFIEILRLEKKAILGGDVLYKKNNIFYHTYDNWYIQKVNNESHDSYLQRSIEISLEYIKNYNNKKINESDLYFVIVFERSLHT